MFRAKKFFTSTRKGIGDIDFFIASGTPKEWRQVKYQSMYLEIFISSVY